MRDLGLSISGARVSSISGQNNNFPATNILDSSPCFWLSCGMFPQSITISLEGISNVVEISLESVNVKTLSVLASTDPKPRNFREVRRTDLGSADGRRQLETVFGSGNQFQARHVQLDLLSGYDHFVAVFHVKIMGQVTEGLESPAKFSAHQLGIQGSSDDVTRPETGNKQWNVFQTKPNSPPGNETSMGMRNAKINFKKDNQHQPATRWGNDDEAIKPFADPTNAYIDENLDDGPIHNNNSNMNGMYSSGNSNNNNLRQDEILLDGGDLGDDGGGGGADPDDSGLGGRGFGFSPPPRQGATGFQEEAIQPFGTEHLDGQGQDENDEDDEDEALPGFTDDDPLSQASDIVVGGDVDAIGGVNGGGGVGYGSSLHGFPGSGNVSEAGLGQSSIPSSPIMPAAAASSSSSQVMSLGKSSVPSSGRQSKAYIEVEPDDSVRENEDVRFAVDDDDDDDEEDDDGPLEPGSDKVLRFDDDPKSDEDEPRGTDLVMGFGD